MTKLFEKLLNKSDIEISKDQFEEFNIYKRLVLEWNKKFNITSITDEDEFDLKHFYDCVLLLKLEEIKEAKSIIDIGTGGGFPGIPLKIMLPETRFMLIDGSKKRISFLQEVVKELELSQIEAVHERAEILARKDDFRDSFDIAVSRAVASLDTLSEYCLPLVKPKGYFIAMKGSTADEEIKSAKNAINILNAKIHKQIDYTLTKDDHNRSLVIIQKKGATPKKYPRAGGAPKNKPLEEMFHVKHFFLIANKGIIIV